MQITIDNINSHNSSLISHNLNNRVWIIIKIIRILTYQMEIINKIII